MKKLLFLMSMLLVATNVYAGAAVYKEERRVKFPGILKADSSTWQGTRYDGSPAKFTSSFIGANINYLTQISVKFGKITVKLPGQNADIVQDGARVRIDLEGNGTLAYDNIRKAYKDWNKSTVALENLVNFEDSGIVMRSTNFERISWRDVVLDSGDAKPEWQAAIVFTMTLIQYKELFAPALAAWNDEFNYLGEPSNNVISGNGMTGTSLIYKKN